MMTERAGAPQGVAGLAAAGILSAVDGRRTEELIDMHTFRNGLGRATSLALLPALVVMFPVGAGAAGLPGTIEVLSEPAGAAVFVDGDERGVTPLSVPGLSAGAHRVRIVKEGFVENSRVVNVAAGGRQSVGLSLTQAQPTPPPPPEAAPQGEGWSTRKKVLVGAAGAAVLIGGIALLSGVDGTADDQPPVAGTISVSPTGLGLAGVTNFTFTSQGASDPENAALTYTWNFGDGATGSGATSAHVYNSAGTFNATLTVSDGAHQVTAAGHEVTTGDVNGTWVNFDPAVGGARIRRVSFQRSGAQLSGTYRTNLAPGHTGSVNGSMTSPNNLVFEAKLQDDLGQQVGFDFEGTFDSTLTSFTGLAEGYLLGEHGKTLVFGREQ